MPSRGIKISMTTIGARMKIPRIAGLRAELRKETKGYAEDIVDVFQDYPPEPELSRYIRTGNLALAWKIKDTSSGSRISFELSNFVRDRYGRYYARWVHGGPQTPQEQAWMHAENGWKTVPDAIAHIATRSEFRATVQDIIELAMGAR